MASSAANGLGGACTTGGCGARGISPAWAALCANGNPKGRPARSSQALHVNASITAAKTIDRSPQPIDHESGTGSRQQAAATAYFAMRLTVNNVAPKAAIPAMTMTT
jgi:hypothetical protein